MQRYQWTLAGLMAVVFGVMASSQPAVAFQRPPNVYFGLGGGIQVTEEEDPLDEQSGLVKGFIGLQPSHYFAFEGGFTEFSDQEGTVGGSTFERSVGGFYFDGVFILPLTSGFDFFMRGGGFRHNVEERSGGSVVTDARGFDYKYGAGMNLQILEDRDVESAEAITMGLRLEWEHYITEPTGRDQKEYDAGTINFVWHFL